MTLYNPHLLTRQELVETFVARQPLLDELVDDLRRGGRQHHLLIGNRGSGKTTLLLRLAAAIEDDKHLAKKCIPLRFPEEQYNVSRPSDFWLNAIDALVDALERQDDRVAAQRLAVALAELEPLAEDDRSRRAIALLESWAKQARRLVVLLVDNLDLILDRLSDSLWALREALSIDNRLVVVGASSKFIEETIHYQSAFYEFFHVHELGSLSGEEARRLVLSLAARANTPKVADILEHDPGRFKALYVLTGGTPRTLALLHTVLALEHSDRIERDLDGLLDQLTPYYKARFDDLPSQSQVIVDKVALHWHPITAAECQAATHLDVNTVSSQLSRLVKSGLLSKVSLAGAAKLGFQLSERFFNIWYLMRASRRLRRRLAWFVEFLRMFYGEEDLQRRAEDLIRAAPADSLHGPGEILAFASAIPDQALRHRLEFRAIGLLLSRNLGTMRELVDLDGEDRHLAPVIDRVRTLRDLRAQIEHAKITWPPDVTASSVADWVIRHPVFSLQSKKTLISGILANEGIDPSDWGNFVGYGNEFSDELLAAIGSGEIPSLREVTEGDIRRILELSGQDNILIVLDLVFYNERSGIQLSDEILQTLLAATPFATDAFAITARRLIEDGNWSRARHIISMILRSAAAPPELSSLLALFSSCVTWNHIAETIDLFVEFELVERWAPLYEALCAIRDKSKSRLNNLAPEMRSIALDIFDFVTAPRDFLQTK